MGTSPPRKTPSGGRSDDRGCHARRLGFAALITLALQALVAIAQPAAAATPSPRLFVAPSGKAMSSCTRADPCASLDRALALARPGERVSVAPGDYPVQQLRAGGARQKRVVFVPQSRGRVRLAGLDVLTSHVEVRGIDTGFVDVHPPSPAARVTDVVIVRGHGSGLFVGGGVSHVTFRGGSYGGVTNETPVKVQGSPAPAYITLNGVDIHDAVRDRAGYDRGVHLECMYAADVQYLTVRNSRFRNCAIFDLFLTNLSGTDPAHVTLENNVFDATASHAGVNTASSKGYYSVSISAHLRLADSYVVRNNSFGQPVDTSAHAYRNVRFVGNVGEARDCESAISYSHNVWTDVRCSPSDRKAPSGFADPAAYDYRLSPRSAAIRAGDPHDHPLRDILGRLRPRQGAPDAGAYE